MISESIGISMRLPKGGSFSPLLTVLEDTIS
jgi:hypothetical protein